MRIIIFLLALLLTVNSEAQDVAFSQYYAAPLLLNPALVGGSGGKFRLTAINRDQWGNVLDNSFKTFGAAIDVRFKGGLGKLANSDIVGAGISFFKDKVTGVDFSTTAMSFYGAYHKLLDKNTKQYLSAGLSLGIHTQNVNPDRFNFSDEFNGTDGYDQSSQEFENPLINNITYNDIALGINYTFSPSREISYYAGAAVHHATEPDNTFYEDEDRPGESVVPRKFTVHGSASFQLEGDVSVIPRAIFTAQGGHNSLIAGSNLRFGIKDTNGTAVHIGAWARPSFGVDGTKLDAVTVIAGVQLQSFIIGTSYDLHISDFNVAGPQRGTFEISITYVGDDESEDVLCPTF